MGEEPRLALMDSDVPNAITNSMNMKAIYRRVHSSLLLFLVSISFLLSWIRLGSLFVGSLLRFAAAKLLETSLLAKFSPGL